MIQQIPKSPAVVHMVGAQPFQKDISLAFRVKSDFSTVITSLDDA